MIITQILSLAFFFASTNLEHHSDRTLDGIQSRVLHTYRQGCCTRQIGIRTRAAYVTLCMYYSRYDDKDQNLQNLPSQREDCFAYSTCQSEILAIRL